jgi:hypothetical protein
MLACFFTLQEEIEFPKSCFVFGTLVEYFRSVLPSQQKETRRARNGFWQSSGAGLKRDIRISVWVEAVDSCAATVAQLSACTLRSEGIVAYFKLNRILSHVRRFSRKSGNLLTFSQLYLGNRGPVDANNNSSVALVRERTTPTERPPLVGEVSANFCG